MVSYTPAHLVSAYQNNTCGYIGDTYPLAKVTDSVTYTLGCDALGPLRQADAQGHNDLLRLR